MSTKMLIILSSFMSICICIVDSDAHENILKIQNVTQMPSSLGNYVETDGHAANSAVTSEISDELKTKKVFDEKSGNVTINSFFVDVKNYRVETTTNGNCDDCISETSTNENLEYEVTDVGSQSSNFDDFEKFSLMTEVTTTVLDRKFEDEETTTVEEQSIVTEDQLTSIDTCVLLNIQHTISKSPKLLSIYWDINDASLCDEQQLTITLINNNCIKYCNDDESCIESCHEISPEVDSSILSYTFDLPLIPCATYVYIVNLTDSNGFRSGVFNADPEYQEVSNLKINDYVETEINARQLGLFVGWDYAFTECPKSFTVIVSGLGKDKIATSTEYFYNFSNIPACEELAVSVYPNDQKELIVTMHFTMRQIQPSPVRDLTLSNEIDRAVINLKYTEPEYGAICIKHYIAEVKIKDDGAFTVDVTVPFISDVIACAVYEISVRGDTTHEELMLIGPTLRSISDRSNESMNTFNEDQDVIEIKSIKTLPRQNTQPQQPQLVEKTSKSLTLRVIRTDDKKNACAIKNFHVKCFPSDDMELMKQSFNDNGVIVIDDLLPYRNYMCTARLENEGGIYSLWSSSANFMTNEGAPNAPEFYVNTTTITSTSFTIYWRKPTRPNGLVKQYKIYIFFSKFNYYVPTYCEPVQFTKKPSIPAEEDKLEYEFTEGYPGSKYWIQIQAVNQDIAGEMSQFLELTTLEDSPSIVKDLRFIKNQVMPREPYNKTISIEFNYPCTANGMIRRFEIRFSEGLVENLYVNEPVVQDKFSYSTDKLEPDRTYITSVTAFTDNHDGKSSTIKVELVPGIPVKDNTILESILTEISTDVVKISIPPKLFKSNVGRISRIKILVAQMGCQNLTSNEGLLAEESNFKVINYYEASKKECIPLYDTGIRLRSGSEVPQKQGIGIDTICEEPKPCNGPLRPGTHYGIKFRLYTETGFSDTAYIKVMTNKQVPIKLIMIIVLTTLCVVFLLGFYISCRKTRQLRKSAVDSPYDRKDISVQNFATYHTTMIQNENEKIKEEYKAIQFYSDNLNKAFIASKANENLNRYMNIYPYDSNRVVLNDDEYENDYINASFVNGYYYPKEYIATQGPKPNTLIDFWRMVIQHQVESIVMLTSLVENNKVKCTEYFPKLNGHIKCANIRITCVDEQRSTSFIKRILEVEKDDVKRKVNHYYFCKWPDHGCPNNALDVIDFVKVVRNDRERIGETFIVHCSAGVGRTGTFIALDIMMQRMKKEGKINIFDLVKQLRMQRMKMVQSCDQYLFLYTAALELVTMPRNPNVLQNFRTAVLKYVNEFKIPKKWKWRENSTIE